MGGPVTECEQIGQAGHLVPGYIVPEEHYGQADILKYFEFAVAEHFDLSPEGILIVAFIYPEFIQFRVSFGDP